LIVAVRVNDLDVITTLGCDASSSPSVIDHKTDRFCLLPQISLRGNIDILEGSAGDVTTERTGWRRQALGDATNYVLYNT